MTQEVQELDMWKVGQLIRVLKRVRGLFHLNRLLHLIQYTPPTPQVVVAQALPLLQVHHHQPALRQASHLPRLPPRLAHPQLP